MVSERTTTISVSTDVWAALDRRKNSGDSFDDVIRRLINATGVGVGDMEGSHPEVGYKDPVELETPPTDENCAHYDVIEGTPCNNTPTTKQPYRMNGSDEWDTFYFCDEHRPEQMMSDGE